MTISSQKITECIRIGKYQKAVQIFKSIPNTTAEEKRWGALALFLVRDFSEVVYLLQTSIAEGCLEAHIELASAFEEQGKIELAYKMLDKLCPIKDELSALDAAFYYRQLAALDRKSGRLELALEHIELAWYQTFLSEEAEKRARYGIAHLMALIYSDLGQDFLAAEYIDIALQLVNPSRKYVLYLNQVYFLGYLGEFERAQKLIDQADISELPSEEAYKLNRQAFIYRNQNKLEIAVKCYKLSIQKARQYKDKLTETFALMEIAMVCLELGNLSEARKYIAQAKMIPKSKSSEMHLDFREAILSSFLDQADTGLKFEKTIEAFESASSRRILALNRVLDYLDALPEDHYAKEIYYDYLEKGKVQKKPTVVTLQSLGQEAILIDDEPVRLTINRAVEIACYLLRHPASKLEEIILALFADDDPKRAKNYFHQSRYDLESAVPGLKVPYDVKTRSYSIVHNNYEFIWDVQALETNITSKVSEDVFGTLMSYEGAFLPTGMSEWAEQERGDITWDVLKAGLQMLEQWYESEDYAKCLDVASKLRELDPLNESLVLYILEATHKLEGEVIAKLKVSQFEKLFQEEVGEFPIQVDTLFTEKPNLLN